MRKGKARANELRRKAADIKNPIDIYEMSGRSFDVLMRVSEGCGGMLNSFHVDILRLLCLFAAEFVESES